MSKLLSRLLDLPLPADPEQARIARLLHTVLLMGVPLAFSFVLFDSEVRAGTPAWGDLIAAIAGCLLLPLIFLLRRGYVRAVSTLLILTTFSAIIVTSFQNYGIRNPSILVIPLLLMLCSVLLGSRSATSFAFLVSAMAIVLYFREQNGILYPQPVVVDIDYLVIVLILISVTTVILHFTINQIVQSAQQIRQQADELHQQNQRLEQIQATLEARTQQLSKLNADLQLEMSERARTESVLRQKQKTESIGLLAGGIAHDFNNLLFSILGQSDLALRRLPGEQPARQHIEKAIQAAQRAADLTRQLLAYAGKARFQIEPVDLNQLIQVNYGLLETMIQHNSRLQLALQPQLSAVAADRGQLQQVLINLVLNASEAIAHEHGQIVIKTFTANLTAALDPALFVGSPPAPGCYVCLQISDNGAGMDQSVLEKIFDPFFTTKERGHGLGLSVVAGVVQALQGGLQVQSQSQVGSTFGVYLPGSNEQHVVNTPLAAALLPAQPNQLILVIDDEAPVREAVAAMLQSIGYHTLVAANGDQGVAIFDQHQGEIGAIVLDVVMPGMNGVETLQKLRAIKDTITVILCSGYSDTALPDSVLQRPATAFLPKPYTLEQLVKVMTDVKQRVAVV